MMAVDLLVVAGPGSGKTRVLTSRVANLILNHGVSPSSVMAITFTRKAAGEMKERLEGLLETSFDAKDVDGIWICTIHSCA